MEAHCRLLCFDTISSLRKLRWRRWFQSSTTGRRVPAPVQKTRNNAAGPLFCLQSGHAGSPGQGNCQMKISQYLPALAIAATLWMSPALAEDSAQTFVDKAAVGGMFEVESSRIALKMS